LKLPILFTRNGSLMMFLHKYILQIQLVRVRNIGKKFVGEGMRTVEFSVKS